MPNWGDEPDAARSRQTAPRVRRSREDHIRAEWCLPATCPIIIVPGRRPYIPTLTPPPSFSSPMGATRPPAVNVPRWQGWMSNGIALAFIGALALVLAWLFFSPITWR